MIYFLVLLNSPSAYNNALPKLGQDIVTSAAVRYQHWFGAGIFLRVFSVILIIIFLNSIAAGRTFFKYPNFGNAIRYMPTCFGNTLQLSIYELKAFCFWTLLLSKLNFLHR
jgi:hypothetical protein